MVRRTTSSYVNHENAPATLPDFAVERCQRRVPLVHFLYFGIADSRCLLIDEAVLA